MQRSTPRSSASTVALLESSRASVRLLGSTSSSRGPVYAEEGDQQRFWKLTRRFLDNLAALQPGKTIRAVS